MTAGPDGLRGLGSQHCGALCCAMTDRSFPIQVLTILPSLPSAPCLGTGRTFRPESGPGLSARRGRRVSGGRSVRSGVCGLPVASPDCSMAQAMRAVLAACASTATLTGRRARMPRCHWVARLRGARMAHDRAGAEREEFAQALVALARDAALASLVGARSTRRVRPHQAAKSRAEANCLPSPIAVTMACAVKRPMPGMVASRRIAGSLRRRHDPPLQFRDRPAEPLDLAQHFLQVAATVRARAHRRASSARSCESPVGPAPRRCRIRPAGCARY